MGPVNWLSRFWSPKARNRSAFPCSEDPRKSIYPEYFVTALEPRRVLNAAPIIAPQSFSVPDDAQAGDLVGTVEASDPDDGDVITFSITAGNSGNVFAIHPDTGVITVNNAGPLANQTSYELTVRVTDLAEATAEAVMTITVVPPPTPPVIGDQFFIVPAGSEAGTLVGQVEVDDLGGGDLTFSITSGNNDNAFAIDPDTGELTVANQLILATPGSRTLTIRVDDIDGEFDTASIDVRINGAPTAIDLSSSEVPENEPGALIGNISVIDPNPDDSFTFELDDNRFEIVGNQLKLKEGVELNFEQEAEVELSITVFDEAGASLTQLFVIEVLDRNDPPTDISLDAQPVEENNPGAIIGLVTVEDEDDPSTSFGTHEFLVMEEDGTESSRLFIDENSQLRLVDGEFFNFEVEPEVVIRILATDNPDEVGGEPRLSVERTFTITVLDVNDPPVAFDKNFTTAENEVLEGNMLVGSEDDPHDFDEDGDLLTVVNINGATFPPGQEILLDSGATLVVQTNGDFTYDASTSDDFRALLAGVEAVDTFNYTITDGEESVSATVSITVVGVNNPPTVNEQTNFVGVENVPLLFDFEELLTEFGVEDPDTPPENLVIVIFDVVNGEISLEMGSGGVGTLFVITPDDFFNGELFFQYQVVDLIDPVNPLESNVGTGTITIAAVNNPPTLEFSDEVQDAAQGMIEDEVLELPGVLFDSFTDVETAPQDATYNIAETSFGVTVEITDGGGLKIIPLANYNGPATVVVEATDTGDGDDPPLTASATLSIWIEPVNDPPTLVEEKFSTPEFTLQEETKDPLTGNVLQNAFDVDTDPILNQGLLAIDGVTEENLAELFGIDFTSVEFVSGGTLNANGSYTLADGGNLFLFPNGEFSYVPEQSYFGVETFEYQVSDMQGATSTGTVRLEVTPINDPPQFTLETDTIELDPLNPSVILITDAVPGPPNEIADNDFFPKAANQELHFSVRSSSNPNFLSPSSIQFNKVNATTWEMVFPVLPFRNEVVQLVVRAEDTGEGPGTNFSEQTVEVRVIVGQVPASSRQFERSEPAAFPAIESVEILPTTPVTPVVTVTPLQEAGSSSQSAAQSERQVVVYLVTNDRSGQLQEEAKLTLSPDMLNDLNSIFQVLPDDRFRIYLHLEDNSRRLVVDVYVRDGRPFNPDDLDDEIVLPDPLELDGDQDEGVGSPDVLPGGVENREHDVRDPLIPLDGLPALEAPRRGLSPQSPAAVRGESSLQDSEDQQTNVSLRWGLVAGGAALLGTKKQRRAEAIRALADFVSPPSHRFPRN